MNMNKQSEQGRIMHTPNQASNTNNTHSTVIIYCHPCTGSFNHAVLQTIVTNLNGHGRPAHVIDLYAEHFDPTYDAEELQLFHTGGTHDPNVIEYLDLLRAADTVIFITPIWWNSIPGMLKGFIDKVMKEGEGLSHTIGTFGVKGELTNIKHAYVFTTSTSPTFFFRLVLGNGVKRIFMNKTLKQLGMKDRHWINFGGITGSTPRRRERYLTKISTMTIK